jgi:hypothetical protein
MQRPHRGGLAQRRHLPAQGGHQLLRRLRVGAHVQQPPLHRLLPPAGRAHQPRLQVQPVRGAAGRRSQQQGRQPQVAQRRQHLSARRAANRELGHQSVVGC